jgi:hypothetical protein
VEVMAGSNLSAAGKLMIYDSRLMISDALPELGRRRNRRSIVNHQS